MTHKHICPECYESKNCNGDCDTDDSGVGAFDICDLCRGGKVDWRVLQMVGCPTDSDVALQIHYNKVGYTWEFWYGDRLLDSGISAALEEAKIAAEASYRGTPALEIPPNPELQEKLKKLFGR